MPKKIKIKLEDLQIKSFRTSINEIKGGALKRSDHCPKVSDLPNKCDRITRACTQ